MRRMWLFAACAVAAGGFVVGLERGASAGDSPWGGAGAGGVSPGRTLTAGAGLSGGGNLTADRTFATDSSEAAFLASGALTCGASTAGKAKVHTTPLQYCDNAATPALQYAAYGDSAGAATGVACASECISDAEVSDTLTASLFVGSGSTTTAVDLATAEVAGELADANVSDTLTCSNATGVACSGSCISDAEVDDTITASSYLPLAGGTVTGQLLSTTFDPAGTTCAQAAHSYALGGSGANELVLCLDGSSTDFTIDREGDIAFGAMTLTQSTGYLSFGGNSIAIISLRSAAGANGFVGSLANASGEVALQVGSTAVTTAQTNFRVVNDSDNLSTTDVQLSVSGAGVTTVDALATEANCADSAGDAACAAAPAGSVVIDATDTSTVVSTTAVTANSQIFLQFDSSLGTRLGITCNTTYAAPYVTARTAATSFAFDVAVAPITNPACFSYWIVN